MRWLVAPAMALTLAGPAWAQEAQTEREAAKDVLQKMDALERSLDVPAMVAKLSAGNGGRDAPHGFEESGSVSRDIPGIGFAAYTSDWPNHTYEMEQDNLKPVGHNGSGSRPRPRCSTTSPPTQATGPP